MFKKLALITFLAVMPVALGASTCIQSTTQRAPDVTQAQADLHLAESRFASVQTAIINAHRAGLLKGDLLVKVKQAEAVAHSAVQVARNAVNSKNPNAISIVSDALGKVLVLVSLFAVEKK